MKPSTFERRDIVNEFQKTNFEDTGKLGVHYLKQDPLKSLIHHGAHSQSLHQMLKFAKLNNLKSRSIETRANIDNTPKKTMNIFASTNDVTPGQCDNISQLIGHALNRKQISGSYHDAAYPSFLKSHGPYKIYDHAQAKGKQYVANLQNINDQAQKRFNQEVQKLQEQREYQKEEFQHTKARADFISDQKRFLRTGNNFNNLEFIQQQIYAKEQRKREFDFREKQYYKPHFGPEETDQLLDLEDHRRVNQRAYINDQLQMQMRIKSSVKDKRFQAEREGELENLDIVNKQQLAEELAKRKKDMDEK